MTPTELQARSISFSRPDGPLILLLEGDAARRAELDAGMQSRGYRVLHADSPGEFLELLPANDPDVIILGLPNDLDDIDLCRQLRVWTDSPIIVLAPHPGETQVVDALDAGADDYIAEPYSMPELLARVRVALRHRALRAATVEAQIIHVGDLTLDIAAHQASVDGQLISLSARLFKLLTLMATNEGKVLTYRNMSSHLWGPEMEGADVRALRVAVSTIRTRLGHGPRRPEILNAPNVGYRLVVPATATAAIAR